MSVIRMQAVKHYSERGAGTPPQNFKTGNFSRSCTDRGIKQQKSFTRHAPTKAVSSKKVSPAFSNGRRTKALPLCMSLEPTLQTSRVWGNAPRAAFLFISISEQCEALFA